MPYFTDLHTYLYRSSQLIEAYPSTRITTKYSLPRRSKSKSQPEETAPSSTTQPKREPSAILTLKTYNAESGICLKYQTDKAAEVGRLLAGLGRLAKGEIIELPVATSGAAGTGVADADKMDIDSGTASAVLETEAKVVTAAPIATQTTGGGAAKGKKKKGKK